jgi:hypothetical protein
VVLALPGCVDDAGTPATRGADDAAKGLSNPEPPGALGPTTAGSADWCMPPVRVEGDRAPARGEWRVGDWWQYRDAAGRMALRVEVVDEAVRNGTWAQRVWSRWSDAEKPGWASCVDEWRRLDDHALLSARLATMGTAPDGQTRRSERAFEPACVGFWGLRTRQANVTDQLDTGCGVWFISIPETVHVPAGTFSTITFESVDSFEGVNKAWVADAACGPVQLDDWWGLVRLESFRCDPDRVSPVPRAIQVPPCADAPGYVREVPAGTAPMPSQEPPGSYLYAETGTGTSWLLAAPESQVVIFAHSVLRVVVHGNHSNDAAGYFPYPPGCGHADIGRLRAGDGPFERMFDAVGDTQCFLDEGTFDVTTVRFDEAGYLVALEMRFWQACRDPYGAPFELRGFLHWEEEPGTWRVAVR